MNSSVKPPMATHLVRKTTYAFIMNLVHSIRPTLYLCENRNFSNSSYSNRKQKVNLKITLPSNFILSLLFDEVCDPLLYNMLSLLSLNVHLHLRQKAVTHGGSKTVCKPLTISASPHLKAITPSSLFAFKNY